MLLPARLALALVFASLLSIIIYAPFYSLQFSDEKIFQELWDIFHPPNLQLKNEIVFPGDVIEVSGSNFHQNKNVTISLLNKTSRKTISSDNSCMTGPEGKFTCRFQIPANLSEDEYIIKAESEKDNKIKAAEKRIKVLTSRPPEPTLEWSVIIVAVGIVAIVVVLKKFRRKRKKI